MSGIKFKITYDKDEDKVADEDEKNYTRWTNDNGKIILNNIPIGKYLIEEIGSDNEKYPIKIQTVLVDTIIVGNDTNHEKTNTASYWVKINKYNEDNNKKTNIKANFMILERDNNNFNSFKNIWTDENGSNIIPLDTEKGKVGEKIFKIEEESTESDYYLDKNNKPSLIFKCKQTVENDKKKTNWILLTDSLEEEINLTTTGFIRKNKDDDQKPYETYRSGVKIKVLIDGDNGLIVSFINDKIGRIELKKLDSETGERLNGAGFKIYFKDIVKDKDGKDIEKKFYIKNDYEYDVATGLANLNWTSSDTDGGTIFTTGIDYGKGKYDEVYSKTYGCNGVIVLKGLPKKNYYAEEVKAPDGYKLSDNVEKNTYKINWTTKKNEYRGYFGKKMTINNIEQNAIPNESMRTIGIQKVDNERRDIKINGVKFKIYKKIYCANHKRSEKHYITKYTFDEKNNKMNVQWTNEYEKDCKPIEFETGYNYLDGNTYFVNSKGETCYIQEDKQHKLKDKAFDGTKGEIILKGMESKVYYASEIDTGNQYYKAETNKIYRTSDNCQGKDINWLIDLKSQDKENVFTINFNRGEDATGGTEKVYIKGDQIYSEATCENIITQISIPQREGYRFLGYKFNESEGEYSFDSYGNLNTNGSLIDLINIDFYTGSLELKAVWEEVETDSDKDIYTVRFNKNGGTGGTDVIYMKDKMLYSDKECKSEIQKIDVPTKDGFTFKGYKLNAQETEYDFNSDGVLGGYLKDLIDLDTMCDMKLYAIWDTIYTIKLEKNGGKGGDDYIYIKDKQLYSDKECTNKISNIIIPENPGYVFKGYKFNAQETNYSIESDGKLGKNFISFIQFEGYSQSMTLYAIWEEQVITNQQTYVDISGYVWKDENAEKATVRNNKYDDGETLLKDIVVKLKDTKGNVVFEASTNDKGQYKFEKVSVEKLKDYYVEFTYNGLLYQNVVKETEEEFTQATSSKAEETTVDRNNLNNNFAFIEYGVSKNLNGNITNDKLKYVLKDHKSTFDFNDKQLKYCDITSKTDKYTDKDNQYGSYLNRRYIVSKIDNGKETYEIDNVNLGLYERAQPDMSLVKDIENVQLHINDVEYTYEYGQKFKNPEYDGFNIKIKFGDSYGKLTYTRPIYESDYLWNGGDKELTAYITYRIQMRNESTGLKTRINSLVDYCSKTYKIEGIGTGLNENNEIIGQVDYENSEYNSDKYQKYIINVNTTIEPGKSTDMYVKLKLSRDDIIKILGDEYHEATGELLNNIAEINSYSTFDQNNNIYAGIDKDSQPGNAIPEKIDTYEDDTDSAPGFKGVVKTNRVISGTVFLDSTSKDTKTGEERNGDGEYGNAESGIEKIDVQLVDANGNIAQIYDETTKSWKEAKVETDKEGNFYISGFIPGNYKVQYKWGGQLVNDENITVQNYKGTIYNYDRYKNINDYWYKDEIDKRLNDAIDDYTIRKKIDDEMKEVTYETYNNENKIKEMISSTPEFKVDVEYSDIKAERFDEKGNYIYEIKNVDFGIAERARQVIELTKNVSDFKITLPNGSTDLFNASLKEDKNGVKTLNGSTSYLRYIKKENGLNGSLTTEIDNEIIQGATAEVKYVLKCTNVGELDYNDENYYLFGKQPENNKDDTVVKITPRTIVDYLDNSWKNKEQNEIWHIDSDKNGKIYGKTQDKKDITLQYNKGDKINNAELEICYTSKLADTTLKPNDSSGEELSLTVTKLLSSNKDGTTLDNDAEIIQVSKNGGSQVRWMPGNYIPRSESSERDDDKAETVRIMPNTGKNLDYATPIIITIVMLGILTTGIILIKKKVLGDKN